VRHSERDGEEDTGTPGHRDLHHTTRCSLTCSASSPSTGALLPFTSTAHPQPTGLRAVSIAAQSSSASVATGTSTTSTTGASATTFAAGSASTATASAAGSASATASAAGSASIATASAAGSATASASTAGSGAAASVSVACFFACIRRHIHASALQSAIHNPVACCDPADDRVNPRCAETSYES
jgi:hypothetical protein